MARPSKCSAEFRSDAIALWRASAGRRTFRDVAADLHVNPETLRTWARDADGSPAAAGASQDTGPSWPGTSHAPCSARSHGCAVSAGVHDGSQRQLSDLWGCIL
ncbi:transposase [Streptomyces maoxianensis]|uniref:Transposase n=1 Tax=Streptomyces maoxianensis TaxID=1459942 RepID=A0ABV9GFA1_9ACTN